MSARASLIEDGGAEASEPDHFFRSPEFLEAEGVTHTVAIELGAGELRLPVIVREIPGSDRLDATSPYGYPGASEVRETPPDPAEIDWARHRAGQRFRPRPDRRAAVARQRDRALRGAARRGGGWHPQAACVSRSGATSGVAGWLRRARAATPMPPPVHGFEAAYAETMARTGAGERYLFSTEYFRAILRSRRSWLLLAGREQGAATAGAIAVASDGLPALLPRRHRG